MKERESTDRPQYHWWWNEEKFKRTRKENIEIWGTPFPFGAEWKNGLDGLAWGYELVRRLNRSRKLVGFWQLRFYERLLLPWPDDKRPAGLPFRNAREPGMQREVGWSPSDALLQWDLRCSDADLSRAFLQYVHGLRHTQGIVAPRRNERRRNRPVSWKAHELLDTEHFEEKTDFGDSERSTISVAKRKGKVLSKRFFRAVRSERERLDPMLFKEWYPSLSNCD